VLKKQNQTFAIATFTVVRQLNALVLETRDEKVVTVDGSNTVGVGAPNATTIFTAFQKWRVFK